MHKNIMFFKRDFSSCQNNLYFTIVGTNRHKVGFTDLMMRWACLYKLGISLNYQYIHLPLESYFTPNVFNFLGFNDNFDLKLSDFLNLQTLFRKKAYEYLEFDYSLLHPSNSIKYFVKKSLKIAIENLFFREHKFIDIPLSEKFLEKYHIGSCKELQKFINGIVDKHSINEHRKNIILRLQLAGGRRELYTLINSEIVDFPNGMSLRSSYLKTKKRDPIDSNYIQNSLKILVHIRQGDTAIIETPWATFIPVYGNKSFTELTDPNNGTYAELIDTQDYYDFTQKLITNLKLEQNNYSTVVSSDGYSRAFSLLQKNLNKLNLNQEQIEKLKAKEQQYNQKFDLFRSLPACKCFIGESDDNLNNFIHSALEANIIITAFRNTEGMLRKLISFYYDFEYPPIIIELFRTRTPYNHEILLGLDNRKAKVIPVQLDNVDWKDLTSKVKEGLKSQANYKT